MLTVLAYDPGVTTGITLGMIEDGWLILAAYQRVMAVDELWDHMEGINPDIIVYEGFEYRNRARRGLELFPVQLIGVINLFAAKYGKELFEQPPGTGFERYKDKWLKDNDMYIPARPHAMDALRHMLYWYNHGSGFRYNKHGIRGTLHAP